MNQKLKALIDDLPNLTKARDDIREEMKGVLQKRDKLSEEHAALVRQDAALSRTLEVLAGINLVPVIRP